MIMEPVYFNTGFIFRFGNNDIIRFGGKEDNIIDTCTITWNKSDILIAGTTLKEIKDKFNLPNIDFSSYAKNKDGTNNLVANLLLFENIPNIYLLGCAICHQLQYRVPLEATFLSGQPNSECNSDNE
jgi:hypothetical protein